MKRLALILFCSILAVGCDTDYSEYGFTDISYSRDTECCYETISFDSDGTFHYSEACGNPVGDADICEGYTYDEDTGIATIEYPSDCDDAKPREIEIISYDETYLEVKIDGKTAIFNNQN